MKRLLLIIFCLISAGGMYAENVSQDQAGAWAMKFFQGKTGTRASIDLEMVWNGEDGVTRASAAPAFYVFNRTDRKGFVVVSGDDLAQPLLGFSMENSFEMENLPDNIRYWLMDRKMEINLLRKHPEWAPKNTKHAWSRGTEEVGNVVKQWETAKWNQDAPYNKFCPMEGDKRTYSGCLPVAYAIALHARKWPDVGVGVAPSYSYESNGVKKTVPPRSLEHAYQWDKMPKMLHQLSDEEAINEVATLIYDCGVMARAHFTSQSTGAIDDYIIDCLKKNMKYSPSTEYYHRMLYKTEEWHQLLKNELNQNGPVVYGGNAEDSGHAFVLDAYTDKNFYRVNWGWSGHCDGFYTLSLLAPDEHGIGGANDGDSFYYYQGAALNMRKAQPDEVNSAYPDLAITSFFYPDHSSPKYYGYYMGLTPDTRIFKQNVPFKLKSVALGNYSSNTLSLEMALAVVDAKNQVKEMLVDLGQRNDFSAGVLTFWIDIQGTITKPIAKGDKLTVVCRLKGMSEWKPVKGAQKAQSYIPLDGGDFATSDDKVVVSSGLKYDDVPRGLTASTAVIKKNEPFMVSTGALTNVTDNMLGGKIAIAVFGKNEVLKSIVSEKSIDLPTAFESEQTMEVSDLGCTLKEKIEEGDFLGMCYQEKEGDSWKLVRPMAGINSRIALKAGAEAEVSLEKQTALTYNKTQKVLSLQTLKGVTGVLSSTADGAELLSAEADQDGKMVLKVDGLKPGAYNLVLKHGKETKKIQLTF